MHDVLSNMEIKDNLRNQGKFILPHTNLEIVKQFVTYEGIKKLEQVTKSNCLSNFVKIILKNV